MKTLFFNFILISLFSCSTLDATNNNNKEPELEVSIVNEENTILLTGTFSEDMYSRVELQLNKIDEDAEHINVLIDSRGGNLLYGLEIQKKLKSFNKPLHCYVKDKAFSMGFFFLVECDKRIVHPLAKIMWHDIKVMLEGYYSTRQINQLNNILTKENNKYHHNAIKIMKIQPQIYNLFRHLEKIVSGQALSKLTKDFVEVELIEVRY
jgi:ATP-dependent protease ClpP protease subunit